MSTSRILAVLVIAALLLVSGLTLYNAINTTVLAANTAQGLHDQRAGEWNAGSNYAGGKLDQHERLASQPVNSLYQQRQEEWQTGSNYANGQLDQHERHSK